MLQCIFIYTAPRSGNTEIELVKINSEETTPLLGHIRPMYIGAGTSIPKLVLCSLLFAALVVGGYLFFEEGMMSTYL